jgi:hypothetical protein
LQERFRLAKSVALAVFFLHVSRFMHKDICAESVVLFGADPEHRARYLGEVYLLGFEDLRSDGVPSVERRFPEALAHRDGDRRLGVSSEDRVFELLTFEGLDSSRGRKYVYTHPQRRAQVFTKATYLHDVYSLGVLLLEIGLWKNVEWELIKFAP